MILVHAGDEVEKFYLESMRYKKLVTLPFLAMIRIYARVISPILGMNCRFQPTCSKYAEESIKRFGLFSGGWLTLKRIVRCNPWGDSGYDPVPENISKKNI